MGIKFSISFGKELGDGRSTKFWLDKWVDNVVLKDKFQRLFDLESDKNALVVERGSWHNEVWSWGWRWRREPRGRELGELEELSNCLVGKNLVRGKSDHPKWWLNEVGEFSVYNLKKLVDERIHATDEGVEETWWSRVVPKKISIFVWRV